MVSAAVVSTLPLSSSSTGLGIVAADHADIPDSSVPWANWRLVTKDYFKTMGLTIVAGRGITEHDVVKGPPYTVVVSQRLAERLWPGENPVGKTAIVWKGQGDPRAEVVGVVSDMRERGLEGGPTLAVYFPAYGMLDSTTLRLVMHTRGRPESTIPVLRQTVAEIDSSLPLSDVRTLEEVVTRSLATRRFTMLLLVVFAGLAVVLAMAGVYGVLAYHVARRTAEIAVRLALGAAPARVLGQTFASGMRPVLAGLVLGVGGAISLSRLMAALLFDVEPRDPLTYAAVATAVALVAALACYLPTRRVLRVDPVVALRAD